VLIGPIQVVPDAAPVCRPDRRSDFAFLGEIEGDCPRTDETRSRRKRWPGPLRGQLSRAKADEGEPVTDPPVGGEKADEGEPVHGLAKNVGTLRLQFTAHQPVDHEQTWNTPIPPWDKPVSQLMMDVMQGKRLWAFLRDQRRTVPEIVVVAAQTLDISLSVGFALCDQLHCDRRGTLYTLNMDPDETFAGDAPNLHIYARVRETRVMVV
jgi:hypothetical protein